MHENREIPSTLAAEGAAGRLEKASGHASGAYVGGKSDSPIVPMKPPNKADVAASSAEGVTNDPAMSSVSALLAARQERTTDMVYETVLKARPLRRTAYKMGGGVFGDQPSATNEVIDAITAFADGVDWAKFQAAFDELLVQTVESCFDDDDRRVLTWLERIVDELRQGGTARDIVGSFMLETPAGSSVNRRTPANRAALIAAARKTYARESADTNKTTICSEKAWVHAALRDAGQSALSEPEIAAPGSSLGGLESGMPGGGQSRAAVIGAAKRAFAKESGDPGKTTICSEKAWVHTALRDAGLSALSETEIAAHGISLGGLESGMPVGGQSRAAVIEAAKLAFATESADASKMDITSEKKWVNPALRDAGQKPLADEEIAKYGISDEG